MKDLWLSILGLSVIALLNLNATAQVMQEWVYVYTPMTGDEEPMAMAVDPQGNILVTGEGESDYLTFKFDPSGALIWMARFNGPNDGSDRAWDLALDSDGNVYVTGGSQDPAGSFSDDCVTVKYDATGVQQWEARYQGSNNSDDAGLAIALDTDRNVYVTGVTGPYNMPDYLTIKYDSLGVEQWVVTYDGPGHHYDNAEDIVVDQEGNIYVTGSSRRTPLPYSTDVATLKYDLSGMVLWEERYCPPAYDYSYAEEMTLDSSGNILIAGKAHNHVLLDDYLTVKYSSQGLLQWAATYDVNNEHSADEAQGIVCDQWNNIYVTGWGDVWATVKYDSTGLLDWVDLYEGWPSSGGDWGNDIVVDEQGNAYVTGESFMGASSHEGITMKFNPWGQREWIALYCSGMINHSEFVWVMALDQANNVYIAGEIQNGSCDWFTVKYSQYSPAVTLELLPAVTPIQIPATGGSFEYQVDVVNNDPQVNTGTLWVKVRAANGFLVGPIQGPFMVDLPQGTSAWHRIQDVPGEIPAGTYIYIGFVGAYWTNWVWDADTIVFEKLPGAVGSGPSDWSNWGEVIGTELFNAADLLPDQPLLVQIAPNPFNPSTVASFELREASKVTLQVYDTAGRLVTTLVDDWREVGEHRVTFDGSGLAAGIYFVRLIAGNYCQVQKMVLLK